jgi:hypothetical protein
LRRSRDDIGRQRTLNVDILGDGDFDVQRSVVTGDDPGEMLPEPFNTSISKLT